MDAAMAQLSQHLMTMLSAFAASVRASQPDGAAGARWSRAWVHLDAELERLRSSAAQPPTAAPGATPGQPALQGSALRLTQLARTLDCLRLEHTAAVPAAQLLDERRLVVFAAWQLLQRLEPAATPAEGSR